MSEFLKSFSHPDELLALLKFKLGGCTAVMPKFDQTAMSSTLSTCYEYLNQTSRSFAAVIQALDGGLRNAVCIFYLVLRALDTVEDDMTIPKQEKVAMLHSFHTHLHDPKWHYLRSQEKDKIVLEDFPSISLEFRQLDAMYQEVIEDICKKMGQGMTVFMEREVLSLQDWDEYCHYVAGLVGIGLSRLFAASGLESEIVGKDQALANNMGLFLQKTNIIRDYLEDTVDGRHFWPRSVWSKYGEKLGDLRRPDKHKDALACLNELVTNALELVPECIKYMSRLRNQSVFNFCAIPQVMAIATLERCFNNYAVFTGVVKIRKGEAVKMMMEATNIEKVKAIMAHFVRQIELKVEDADPSASETRCQCQKALAVCQTRQEYTTSSIYPPLYVSLALMLSAILYKYWTLASSWYEV